MMQSTNHNQSSKRQHPRAPCTPEAWVPAAAEVLVDRGIDRVRVDVLAQELGMTRGRLYWHFKDREEFLSWVLHA